jgi:hypothetical protein
LTRHLALPDTGLRPRARVGIFSRWPVNRDCSFEADLCEQRANSFRTNLYKYMKPTSIINPNHRPAHRDGDWPPMRSFPLTDYHFKSASEIIGAGTQPEKNRASQLRMFRRLSSNFLGSEMSRDYVREASLFVLIAVVSAWPIVSMIRALIGLPK